MKKIYYTLIFLFISFINKAHWLDVKDWMLNWSTSKISNNSDVSSWDWLNALWEIFKWAKSELMAIVSVAAVAVFIYIGIKIATAKWNPEEFKKAWLHLVYAVIGIFIVFIAYWAVVLISSLSL